MEKELFSAVLGIEEPVYIDEIVLDTTEGELHIHMNFRRGGRFRCSEWASELPVHDTVEKTCGRRAIKFTDALYDGMW